MTQGFRVTIGGMAIGLLISALASRLLATLLQGVSPMDAVTWSSAVGLWIAVALVAGWLPARRATRVVLVMALREEYVWSLSGSALNFPANRLNPRQKRSTDTREVPSSTGTF
jgi:hypothetical protein